MEIWVSLWKLLPRRANPFLQTLQSGADDRDAKTPEESFLPIRSSRNSPRSILCPAPSIHGTGAIAREMPPFANGVPDLPIADGGTSGSSRATAARFWRGRDRLPGGMPWTKSKKSFPKHSKCWISHFQMILKCKETRSPQSVNIYPLQKNREWLGLVDIQNSTGKESPYQWKMNSIISCSNVQNIDFIIF